MTAAFIIIALFTVAAAVGAMCWRNLVHCALTLILALAGLAALYLQLDAQFVGFAQILIYVGAVAILIVFAILLTRGAESSQGSIFSGNWAVGAAIALLAFGVLARVIVSSRALPERPTPVPEASVRQIGNQLMGKYVLPLEVIGLLLTAALIGAVVIALRDKEAS
jgi:NADH:ubiquinone oxidoreductase subunit 6 (subunit J)